MTARIEQLGTNLLIVTPGSQSQTNVRGSFGGSSSTDSLTNDDVVALEQVDGIAAISPEYSGRKQVIYQSQNTNTTVTGVLPAYEEVRNYHVASGQFISEKIMKITSALQCSEQMVDTLLKELILLGKQYALKIVFYGDWSDGKKEQQSMGQNMGNVIFIPLLTAQIRLFGEKSLSTIYISAENSEEMESVMEDVEYTLLREHEIANADDADFTVLNQSDAIETMSEVTQIFTLLLGGIAGISLLVGGIGVMNIMLVSVTERTREIGIRKAIGAKEKDILLQFLTESTFLSVAGGFWEF